MEREQAVAVAGEYAVVDASVVAKWFVQEELTDKALSLRTDYLNGKVMLACPDLLGYEVMNALRYKPTFGAEDLKQVAAALRKYNLLSWPILDGTLAERTIDLAVKYGITVYDGSYLALGEHLDSVVYTADGKLVGKVANEKLVASISRYKPY